MRRVVALPILLCGLALAACDPPAGPGVPTADGGSAAAATASGNLTVYAACIREHGVNVPDPAPDANARAWIRQQAEADPAFDAASRRCVQLAPADSGEHAEAPTAQELDARRAFAVCMRAHDIDMSDPDPATGDMRLGGRLANASKAQMEADPGLKAANEACRDKLPQGSKP
jgi:hypothetical protein